MVCNRLQSYPEAIKKEFNKHKWRRRGNIIHGRNAGIRKIRTNNNPVERYHNEQREFDKVRRGFDKVKEWQNGFILYHNFIKENSIPGKTPAQAAAIELTDKNKWHSLLKKSCGKSEQRFIKQRGMVK